jgi:hypothetical protein
VIFFSILGRLVIDYWNLFVILALSEAPTLLEKVRGEVEGL